MSELTNFLNLQINLSMLSTNTTTVQDVDFFIEVIILTLNLYQVLDLNIIIF